MAIDLLETGYEPQMPPEPLLIKAYQMKGDMDAAIVCLLAGLFLCEKLSLLITDVIYNNIIHSITNISLNPVISKILNISLLTFLITKVLFTSSAFFILINKALRPALLM